MKVIYKINYIFKRVDKNNKPLKIDYKQSPYYKGEHIRYDHFFVDGHRSRWMNPDYRCADWTDDTDQCLLILDSITRHNGECNPFDFAQHTPEPQAINPADLKLVQ